MARIEYYLRHPLKTIERAIKKFFRFCLKALYSIWYGKKIILFESHYEFDGNSGALYKYLRGQSKYNKYTFVWIVKGFKDGSYKNTRRDLVFSKGNNSFKKEFLIKKANLAFFDDVPIRAGGKGARTVYLTHGQFGLKNSKGIINLPDYVDDVLCISEYYKSYWCYLISCPPDKIFISGLPRNDTLFSEKVDVSDYFDENKYNKVILWLPTFRKVDLAERNDETKDLTYGIPFFYMEAQLQEVNNFLKEKNMLLVLKLHPRQDLTVICDLKMSNIVFINHKSLISKRISTNMLYPHSDALISDYSSAAADYMLLDKPLAYIVEDQDNYKLNLPKETYEQRTPGDKIKTTKELICFLQNVFDGKDPYKEKRHNLVNLIHTYQDGNNCKRIAEKFIR